MNIGITTICLSTKDKKRQAENGRMVYIQVFYKYVV
jgi:hypothetical protein